MDAFNILLVIGWYSFQYFHHNLVEFASLIKIDATYSMRIQLDSFVVACIYVDTACDIHIVDIA